jgi:hypothetical protein
MNVTLTLATTSLVALAMLAPQCKGTEAVTAKDEMKGKIVFSQDNFEDAKKSKTFEEFKSKYKVVSEMVVNPPNSALRYYAVFQEPLNATEYIVQVFDKTEIGTSPIRSEKRDAKADTTQTTAGWSFDVPTWPPPTDADKIAENNVWIKPGHTYEVMILKPMAKGEFSVAGTKQADPTPTPTPGPKTAKKGEEPMERSKPPVKKKTK